MPYEITEIKKIRKKLGLTQFDLAKASGVSQSLIAKIEAGRLDPSYSNIRKIFDALDELSKKEEKLAKDIMQKKIISVGVNNLVLSAIKLMKKHGISQVPVEDKGKIVGIVTEKSLVERLGPDISKLKVKEVMDESPPIISPETRLEVISNLLKHFQIILVAEKGDYKGLISKTDLLEKVYG
ncbi:MAG: CBS domain-containing protein [Nanoarchaeota archaeon]|nr:CBS domain-containing protein [Nanoarchaeota archaeon]